MTRINGESFCCCLFSPRVCGGFASSAGSDDDDDEADPEVKVVKEKERRQANNARERYRFVPARIPSIINAISCFIVFSPRCAASLVNP